MFLIGTFLHIINSIFIKNYFYKRNSRFRFIFENPLEVGQWNTTYFRFLKGKCQIELKSYREMFLFSNILAIKWGFLWTPKLKWVLAISLSPYTQTNTHTHTQTHTHTDTHTHNFMFT